jgi:hypothetical protein
LQQGASAVRRSVSPRQPARPAQRAVNPETQGFRWGAVYYTVNRRTGAITGSRKPPRGVPTRGKPGETLRTLTTSRVPLPNRRVKVGGVIATVSDNGIVFARAHKRRKKTPIRRPG